MSKFPFYRQQDSKDSGPTCLRIICKHFGKNFNIQTLREKAFATHEGTSINNLSDAAESLGLKTLVTELSLDRFFDNAVFPCVIRWGDDHYIIVYKTTSTKIYVCDPKQGLVTFQLKEFAIQWNAKFPESERKVEALLIEATPAFYTRPEQYRKANIAYYLNYFKPYKRHFTQVFFGMIATVILTVIFPFLTRAIIDRGVNLRDMEFINVILIAQVVLLISRSVIGHIQSWIFLYVESRINLVIVADFLIKLLNLPISYFNSKSLGDVMQRIGDHKRIESFISSGSLSTIVSMFNLLIFGIILYSYSVNIFLIFFISTLAYISWVLPFSRRRRLHDSASFSEQANDRNILYELFIGIKDIKLNNCEKKKRWKWERGQAQLYKAKIGRLSLDQIQQSGAFFISEAKNILITITAANLVIKGEITLGTMIAIQYILGQLNLPVGKFMTFLNSYHDAKISADRLLEIRTAKSEHDIADKIKELPQDKSIRFKDVSFRYEGKKSEPVLDKINFTIPEGKITAIVGESGSGKTTLLKLLLRFFEPTSGEIKVGNRNNLSHYDLKMWRSNCGSVLQDSFLFNDTIENNIALSDEKCNKAEMIRASKVSNIDEYVETLRSGYSTPIGTNGRGISQGQKQRILIARAVYKNPHYIFFDEATNSLDNNNEKIIMENLRTFFNGKTVLIIAHRLNTVKDADQIIVMDKGRIVEIGTHSELVGSKLKYYNLFKNQLSLN